MRSDAWSLPPPSQWLVVLLIRGAIYLTLHQINRNKYILRSPKGIYVSNRWGSTKKTTLVMVDSAFSVCASNFSHLAKRERWISLRLNLLREGKETFCTNSYCSLKGRWLCNNALKKSLSPICARTSSVPFKKLLSRGLGCAWDHEIIFADIRILSYGNFRAHMSANQCMELSVPSGFLKSMPPGETQGPCDVRSEYINRNKK